MILNKWLEVCKKNRFGNKNHNSRKRRIYNMPEVNTQNAILKTQYLGTCKRAYILVLQ